MLIVPHSTGAAKPYPIKQTSKAISHVILTLRSLEFIGTHPSRPLLTIRTSK